MRLGLVVQELRFRVQGLGVQPASGSRTVAARVPAIADIGMAESADVVVMVATVGVVVLVAMMTTMMARRRINAERKT